MTDPKSPTFHIQDFQRMRIIYVGTLSSVQVVLHIATNTAYILKIISKFTLISLNKTGFLLREANILDTIRNPFIVRCFSKFQDGENLYMLFEYLQGGDLCHLLKLRRSFSVDQTRFYLAEIIEALNHLHCRNVIYRGLKPENIVLDNQGHLKIVDFGMAKRLDDDERTFTVSGTPEYLPPEVIIKLGHAEEADLWTLGVVLFEFLTGKLPFSGRAPMILYDRILNTEPNFSKIVDKEAEGLCRELLTKDFIRRIKLRDVKKHQFFQGVNWRSVATKKMKVIHVPIVTSMLDSSNFSFVDEVPKSQPFLDNVNLFPGF